MTFVNPYLSFNGNAEEALLFYKSVFGGEVAGVQRFKETPGSEKLAASESRQNHPHSFAHRKRDGSHGSRHVGIDGQTINAGTNVYLFIEVDDQLHL